MKLFWMAGFVTAGLLAQDNKVLGLADMLRNSKQAGVPAIDLFSQDPWVENSPALASTPAPSLAHSETAGVCSVQVVDVVIPKEKNFTMIQMTPGMPVKPPVSSCVVEPSPKSLTHPER